jgi:hypothetical protein
MNNQHPVVPSFEIVNQWHKEACKDPCNGGKFIDSKTLKYIATKAAQWGADQELEACCEWTQGYAECGDIWCVSLRFARRPKPPSLREQALAALNVIEDKMLGPTTEEILIRKALEALPND